MRIIKVNLFPLLYSILLLCFSIKCYQIPNLQYVISKSTIADPYLQTNAVNFLNTITPAGMNYCLETSIIIVYAIFK